MNRYLVHATEVTARHGTHYLRDLTVTVEAPDEITAVRAALTPGDNALHLPTGTRVLGAEQGPCRPVPESWVVGVVGVEEAE